jgi:DNA-binding NtrC family response regulator
MIPVFSWNKLMTIPLNVLIVDDDRMMAKTLKDILTIKGFQADLSYSGAEALTKIQNTIDNNLTNIPFDCVLSDIKMPGFNGVELFKAIRNIQPNLPVVLMTANTEDYLVKEGLRAGVMAVLDKPLNIGHFLSFLTKLSEKQSVIIVEDDPEFCGILGSALNLHGFKVNALTHPAGLMAQLEQERSVLLLDMRLGNQSGLSVLEQLRSNYPDLTVIIVTDYSLEMATQIQAARAYNVYARLLKPVDVKMLLNTLNQIRHKNLGKILSTQAG